MINPKQYTDDKLIILYILNKIKIGISKEQLAYIIIQNIQINYFDIQLNINDLLEKNLIIEYENNDEKKVLNITNDGETVLNELESIIPIFTRELIDRYLVENEENVCEDIIIESHISQITESDYQVYLSLQENSIKLMELNINVPSVEIAESISQKWKKDPQIIYSSIIKILN